MAEQNINIQPAYKTDNVPRTLIIKCFDLYYKTPALKNNKYRYRRRKTGCKYFIKINRENLTKLSNKENDIIYTEYNQHSSHIEKLNNKEEKDNIRTVEEEQKFANSLITPNINQPLEFHLTKFKNNKILWKKNKIRNLIYNTREELFPKEEEFLNNI